MQSQTQLERQVKHSNRSLRNILRIKYANIIPQYIQMIQQRHDIPISLPRATSPWDKRRLLECRPWPSPEGIPNRPIPGEMTDGVEQPPSRGAAAFCIIGPRAVDIRLPVMVVFNCQETFVNARKFSRKRLNFLFWFNPRVRWGLWIENPASRHILEFVALVDCSGRCVCRGKEEEHISIGNRQVEDYLSIVCLVTTDGVALECCFQISTKQINEFDESPTILRSEPTNILRLSS